MNTVDELLLCVMACLGLISAVLSLWRPPLQVFFWLVGTNRGCISDEPAALKST